MKKSSNKLLDVMLVSMVIAETEQRIEQIKIERKKLLKSSSAVLQ